MSAIEEVIAAIESVADVLRQSQDATAQAMTKADDGLNSATELGVQVAMDGFTSLKDSLDKLAGQIGAVQEVTDEAMGAAQSVQASL
ncbi:MAG: hypothetical protein QG608_1388 [Actinomycetota bacterium]|nr:hypothetical protein [Actinomycetota bacterium]